MDETKGFAYRCLPLTMANHMGWVIRCPCDFAVTWNGLPGKDNLYFTYRPDVPYDLISSFTNHFGHGILTISLPWLFRTCTDCPPDCPLCKEETPPPHEGCCTCDKCMEWEESRGPLGVKTYLRHTNPKVGLLVRGLPNDYVFNAHPLEGYVETWWLPFTFTMNWKIQTPHNPVLFRRGDPLCFIQPCDISLLKGVVPTMREMGTDLAEAYTKWGRSRDRFNYDPKRTPEEWQRDYHLEAQDKSVKLKGFHELRREGKPEEVERSSGLGCDESPSRTGDEEGGREEPGSGDSQPDGSV